MLKPQPISCQTSTWMATQLAGLRESALPSIPVIGQEDIRDVLPGFQLWDCWPFETTDGARVELDGWTPWVVMCAPRDVHPDLRHDIARLRLMLRRQEEWRDCGDLLPETLNPGSREWAGSTVCDPESGEVTLYFTAAGRRGEATKSFEQRIFQTSGRMVVEGGLPRIEGWSDPTECFVADGAHYVIVNQAVGAPGFIKGFRDPFHFRDPADGQCYLLFTGSLAASHNSHNGVIGIARADGSGWELLPPLISANGLNNELERPMLRMADGHYYLFWSTQRRTFAPDGPNGPNGLYGMVAESLLGPYRPLNDSGLVAPNPLSEQLQTYSWWVTRDFEVAGFVDHWGMEGRSLDEHPELYLSHFGGVPAPLFRLAIRGDRGEVAVP